MLIRCTPIVVGLCLLLLGCRPNEPAQPSAQQAPGAVKASTAGGGANPIEDYRQARYQEAIRGLTYESGFVERAEGWEKVLADGPGGEDVEALLKQGEALLDENLFVDAIRTYTRVVLLEPQTVTAYRGLGQALIGKGKTDKVIASYRTALRLDPSLIETRYDLALTYWMQDDSQQAVDTWREVLGLDPNHAKSHERLSISLYYLGEYESSWRHFHAAEALGHEMPPQFKPLLAQRMAEPES